MPSEEEQKRFIQLVGAGNFQDVSEELQKKPSLIKSRDLVYGKETTTQVCLCILILVLLYLLYLAIKIYAFSAYKCNLSRIFFKPKRF